MKRFTLKVLQIPVHIAYQARRLLLCTKAIFGDRRSIFKIHVRNMIHAGDPSREIKSFDHFVKKFDPDLEELQETFAVASSFMSWCSQELKEKIIDQLLAYDTEQLSAHTLGSILGETARQSVAEQATIALLAGKRSFQELTRAAGAITLGGTNRNFDDSTAKALSLPVKHALVCAAINPQYLRYVWQYTPELRTVIDALYPTLVMLTHAPYTQFTMPSLHVHMGTDEPEVDFSDLALRSRIEGTKSLLNEGMAVH